MTRAWTGQGRLTADGKSLEYGCFGPGPDAAPTIVLLHEGLGCLALWRGFPQALVTATGFGVLAYSRSGYGGSDHADLPRPLDYMTREATAALPDVLDQAGIRRAVLLGHSDGATIAAIHAGSVSDMRVRAIILMAPHFFTEDLGLAEIENARRAFETGDLKARMAKYHRDPEHTFRGWNDSWLDPGFRAWDVSDVLDYIRVPTLAVQGREDPYGSLDQIAEIEARVPAPVESLILDDCGHAPFLERPDEVVSRVAGFCTRLERIEAAGPEHG